MNNDKIIRVSSNKMRVSNISYDLNIVTLIRCVLMSSGLFTICYSLNWTLKVLSIILFVPSFRIIEAGEIIYLFLTGS